MSGVGGWNIEFPLHWAVPWGLLNPGGTEVGSPSSSKDHMALPAAHAPAQVLFIVDLVGSQCSQKLTAAVDLFLGDTLVWGSRLLSEAHSDHGTGGLGAALSTLLSGQGSLLACPLLGEGGFKRFGGTCCMPGPECSLGYAFLPWGSWRELCGYTHLEGMSRFSFACFPDPYA